MSLFISDSNDVHSDASASIEDSDLLQRILVPMAKYRCCRRGVDQASKAIEIFGGTQCDTMSFLSVLWIGFFLLVLLIFVDGLLIHREWIHSRLVDGATIQRRTEPPCMSSFWRVFSEFLIFRCGKAQRSFSRLMSCALLRTVWLRC
jgi:hypothetical protein